MTGLRMEMKTSLFPKQLLEFLCTMQTERCRKAWHFQLWSFFGQIEEKGKM